ncbi:D-aminoacyl-tRNA deacylase [Flavobacterium sp. UMI-01]|uniref:D-aminoacyl-tRNA deacylase n=1 Tax=Flavobacterium sp. UMI-01 TaxID=1441053 RepID=UPI001C7DE2E9|nr:D-aminoacyl-tRNA deacylase [Flavobacterium sp. UMI-01]GIZ09173.1 D-aminoacyl-tRNA deacylase [Flavobacterium sp. UMI-01]
MRVLLQRVSYASVVVEEQLVAVIQKGLLVLVGVEDADTSDDIDWLVAKIVKLRIFGDTNGVMNCSVQDVDGELLVVSQFTLHAATKKGNRPSYIRASKPDYAIPMYNEFVHKLEYELGKKVQTGIFGADMKVSLTNDGPVTIMIDSKNKE